MSSKHHLSNPLSVVQLGLTRNTLEYTGPAFNQFGPPVTGPGQVNATITLDPSITTLTNGLNITDPHVTSFSLSALGRTIDSGNVLLSFFDLTIGPSLLPETWVFGAGADLGEGTPLPLGEVIFSDFSSVFADGFLVDVDLNTLDIFGATAGAIVEHFQSEPGIWTVQQTSIPDPSNTPVPEPSTMFLLGSGLVGLIGYRMKKVRT